VVRARYVAERSEIAVRYREWEINRVPGVRQPIGGAFNPWRGGSRQTWRDAPEATVSELPLAAYSVEKLLGYLVEEFSGGLRRPTEWRSSILSRSEKSKFWDADPEHLPFEFFNRIGR
jgi:hypothetical protein